MSARLSGPTYGDPSQVVLHETIVISISAGARRGDLYIDGSVMVGPYDEATAVFEGGGEPVTDDVKSSVVDAISSRLAKV